MFKVIFLYTGPYFVGEIICTRVCFHDVFWLLLIGQSFVFIKFHYVLFRWQLTVISRLKLVGRVPTASPPVPTRPVPPALGLTGGMKVLVPRPRSDIPWNPLEAPPHLYPDRDAPTILPFSQRGSPVPVVTPHFCHGQTGTTLSLAISSLTVFSHWS